MEGGGSTVRFPTCSCPCTSIHIDSTTYPPPRPAPPLQSRARARAPRRPATIGHLLLLTEMGVCESPLNKKRDKVNHLPTPKASKRQTSTPSAPGVDGRRGDEAGLPCAGVLTPLPPLGRAAEVGAGAAVVGAGVGSGAYRAAARTAKGLSTQDRPAEAKRTL